MQIIYIAYWTAAAVVLFIFLALLIKFFLILCKRLCAKEPVHRLKQTLHGDPESGGTHINGAKNASNVSLRMNDTHSSEQIRRLEHVNSGPGLTQAGSNTAALGQISGTGNGLSALQSILLRKMPPHKDWALVLPPVPKEMVKNVYIEHRSRLTAYEYAKTQSKGLEPQHHDSHKPGGLPHFHLHRHCYVIPINDKIEIGGLYNVHHQYSTDSVFKF